MGMDEDEFEGVEGVRMIMASDSEPALISNDGSWPSTAMKYHPLDMVVCVAGLAANISSSFTVFFADIRRDLCAARNRETATGVVAEFDEQLFALPVAPPEE
jgi:hypothetical protein